MKSKKPSHIIRLGIAALEDRLDVHRATVWRWYRAGKFPEPHFVGERRSWFLSEIEDWERQRMERSPSARRGPGNLGARAARRTK